MRKDVIIDRVIRIYVRDVRTKRIKFMLDQVKDVSTSATMETQEVLDALDTPITELARSKAFEMSGSNALFHLDLEAEQFGTEVDSSAADNTFLAPCAEEIEYAKGATTVTLAHAPADAAALPYIYQLVDGQTGEAYAYAATASESAFSVSGTTLTLPTGLSTNEGGTILAVYDYTANGDDKAHQIVNQGDKFPEMVNVLVEVLFRDVCDDSKKMFGFLEMGRAKFDGNVDNDLTPDGDHPFTIRAFKEYCSRKQELCTWTIPDSDD